MSNDRDSQGPRKPSQGRFAGLDGLRGLAALGVVIDHYFYHAQVLFPQLGAPVRAAQAGQQGVRLFFVISGFVILMSLQGSSLRTFAIKRWIRLYPIYWISALLTFVVVAYVGLPGREASDGQALLNITMMQTYFGSMNIDGSYWTLAIELGFYVQAAILWRLGWLSGGALPRTLFAWLAACFTAALFVPRGAWGSTAWAFGELACNLP